MLSQSSVGIFVLIGFTFALNYHLSNGIRHLFWDFGHGFELATVYKSGFAVVLSAIILISLYFFLISDLSKYKSIFLLFLLYYNFLLLRSSDTVPSKL